MRIPKAYRVIATSLLIPIFLLACASIVIGLTLAPCYSSMCVERFFPYQTRVHIAVFYSLVGSIYLILSAERRFSTWFRRSLALPIWPKPLLFGLVRPTSISRMLLALWVVGAGVLSTTYWLPAEEEYWMARVTSSGWVKYIYRVTWTGVVGHWVDIWIGLAILPVGRNSLLAKTFHAQRHSMMWAHKLLGYIVLVGGLIHGLLYYSFLAAWVNAADNEAIFHAFNPDNPTLTWDEAEAKGLYSWFCLPTGALAGLVLITTTAVVSLPYFRRWHFNIFYFSHVVLAIAIVVALCLHASTNFYLLFPGLLLWVYDWACRLRNALVRGIRVDFEDAGNGWYRIRLPQLQKELNGLQHQDLESNGESGLATPQDSPLQTYYIKITQISRFEAHPFTVVSDSEDGSSVLLFRKSPERKKAKARDLEWTWKLAALLQSQTSEKPISLQARLEGPYHPQTKPLLRADHVLAIVGGTGITGAISLLNWWFEHNREISPSQKSFCLVWTVRGSSTAQISEIAGLNAKVERAANITFRIHDSEKEGRLSHQQELTQFIAPACGRQGRVWVYASGPTSLLNEIEDACGDLQKMIRRGSTEGKSAIVAVDSYIASYAL